MKLDLGLSCLLQKSWSTVICNLVSSIKVIANKYWRRKLKFDIGLSCFLQKIEVRFWFIKVYAIASNKDDYDIFLDIFTSLHKDDNVTFFLTFQFTSTLPFSASLTLGPRIWPKRLEETFQSCSCQGKKKIRKWFILTKQ